MPETKQMRRNARNWLYHGKRFAKVDPETAFNQRVWKFKDTTRCWEWQGPTNESGFGYFKIDGKLVMAHRYAAYLAGLVSDYRANKGNRNTPYVWQQCDNRKCCNQHHLVVGTSAERSVRRARAQRRLTNEQVIEIRQRVARGEKRLGIAVDYGISQQMVSLIGTWKAYADVAMSEPAAPASSGGSPSGASEARPSRSCSTPTSSSSRSARSPSSTTSNT